MGRVYASCLITAPIQDVWQFVRDFNGLPKWFPGVTDSKIEDGLAADQIGCVRNFGVQGGRRMREQLVALSDVNHSWTYKIIEGPLPISNYVPTFRLLPVTDQNYTFLEGAVRFDCAKERENEMTTFPRTNLSGCSRSAEKPFRRHQERHLMTRFGLSATPAQSH